MKERKSKKNKRKKLMTNMISRKDKIQLNQEQSQSLMMIYYLGNHQINQMKMKVMNRETKMESTHIKKHKESLLKKK